LRHCREEGERGVSVLELVLAVGLIIGLAGLLTPLTASAIDSSRARQAAGFAAARLRAARQQAVSRTTSTGLVFDLAGNRWTFRVCVDGNGNGLRRADLRGGIDLCGEGPVDLALLYPGVEIAIDPTIRGPDGDPPSSDPVRFGSSNLASFSPSGGCTPGTLFMRSARGVQYAVRVAGVTGRTRLLRYDPPTRSWKEV
jgi:type II secretory pathway pseudopilin PulG